VTPLAQEPGAPSLEQVAIDLRQRHRLSERRPREIPLLQRASALTPWLASASRALQRPAPALAKAADWLLDNDYVIERAARQVRRDLPRGFYARLPRLEGGEGDGLPRVFSLAQGFLQGSRLQFSLEGAERFVNAYQGATHALTIAELWALPTLLRVACLELLVTSLERLTPELRAPAPAALPTVAPPGLDDSDCVARAIANLGVIDAISWKDFFQLVSRVEAELTGDPAGVYARMDFETRDRYRRVIEELADAAGCSELRVAERVVGHARTQLGRADELDHVGYWLVGGGQADFESSLGCRPSTVARAKALLRRNAGVPYGLALALATCAAVVVPAVLLWASGARWPLLLGGIAIAVLPASVVSFALVNWCVTLLAAPSTLPKLDFGEGVPDDCRCLVAIPALASSEQEARDLLERLESHYLGNPDPALDFALLTDCADAPLEDLPEDAAIVAALQRGIRGLNTRHARGDARPFHLLHRARRFNPREGCWMGWERKRGKLEELNHLLAGEPSAAFSVREGDDARLTGIRFVITLDADTQLPTGAAQRMIGTFAHPLNRARFDTRTGRVRSGYTVIQPRVEISPEAGNRSRFARLFSGDTAIDIYTHAVSDVYQDLFGSGTFVGKGIYEVASFRESLAGRVPDDALASHDLFEGAHGRAALASDIVLYEGFPSRYEAFARRWHRWVRGDWQLLPWLTPTVPGPGGARLSNRLPALDRWKILDNLRRSMLPPALVALFAAGWLVLPGNAWAWTALGVLAPSAYLMMDLVTGLARGRRRGAVRGALRTARNQAGFWLLAVTFLANDAFLALDAITRTLWRLAVSRKHLLQWTAAAAVDTSLSQRDTRRWTWRVLAPSPLIALALGCALALLRPAALPAAAGVLLLWLLAPEFAFWSGRARRSRKELLSAADVEFLRRLARRTWLYFETLVGPEDHWLPPDNLQEHPRREIAHRTSPTNVGMALLSSVVATDLGYVGLSELAARVRNTLDTLDRLPRHRGHLLNWYDTRSLAPLEPRYVSTVDSGNLAVTLVALKESLRALSRGPALRPQAWDGLRDVLGLLADGAGLLPRAPASGALVARVQALADLALEAARRPERHFEILHRLAGAESDALNREISHVLEGNALPADALRELRTWLERTQHHVRAMQHEVEEMAPWLSLLTAAPPEREQLAKLLSGLLPVSLPLTEVAARCAHAREALETGGRDLIASEAGRSWDTRLGVALEKGAAEAETLCGAFQRIARRAEAFAWQMDFRSIYDPDARRFRIGYNASADRFDPNHYDLLASEARLASFFAIAKGDAPVEHWFHLGRAIALAPGGLALISWGGSMFEYLMPPLLLRSERGTLLAQSERAAVATQMAWARRLGIPWGVSESAFASTDPSGSYRYQSFGVPGLGLRRGLARDRVVAPYASALALPIRKRAAVENLRALESLSLMGAFGLYEAVDFTPDRLPSERSHTPVRTYMAHHQGMILAALGNALHDDVLVRRFHADLRMRSTEMLLHERVPLELPPAFVREEPEPAAASREGAWAAPAPWNPEGVAGAPRIQTLGNGRLCSWVSAAGAGGLRWNDQALTRWRPDATRDDCGLWIYFQDTENGSLWSAGRQPTGRGSEDSRAVFHAHRVELHRRERGIATHLDVAVVPGDDLEIRRLTITNERDETRTLRVTSYAEVVLAPPLEDERHPAYSKLFVRSEWLPRVNGLLFTRRPRRPLEQPPALLHRVILSDPRVEYCGHESDRATFLGRGGDMRRPHGAAHAASDRSGFTLDPVMSLQLRVTLGPYERCDLAFVTLAGGSRESVLESAGRYETLAALDWAVADAGADAARDLQQRGIPSSDLRHLQALGSLLLTPCGTLGGEREHKLANKLGQSRLWGLGISGDHPILLLKAADSPRAELLEQVVRAHGYWQRRGIRVDLVVMRRGVSGYVETLREQLSALLAASGASGGLGHRAGIHLVLADQVHEDELRLLEACAHVVLDDARGSLADQLAAAEPLPSDPPQFLAPGPFATAEPASPRSIDRPRDLLFDNELGGFTPDGREYVIHLEAGAQTPAPWVNVLANDEFGCIVSEAGGGFTWSGNSGENRITPWSNDPVADPPSEALLLRDEQTGEVFSVTPQPAGGATTCQVRHGAGRTRWRRASHELDQELEIFVPPDAPVKVARLRLENLSPRPRRITATYWAEWCLGALPSVSRHHVVCEWGAEVSALLATNPWSADFGACVAFLTATLPPHGVTADRREFLGVEGDLSNPAALGRWGLSGRTTAPSDPGAAYQVHLELAPNAHAELCFILGQGRDRAHALALASEWRAPARIARAAEELSAHWDRLLGAVQVRTPDPAFDVLVNRWLLYQTLASRVLARAGFYQASGAFGFRDQLQDVLALLHADPQRARAHLLACAAHQFEDGDVLHWWHPPADRGVRTRCSDDLLWLPYAVSCYVEATGDTALLDEEAPFLHAPELSRREHDRYARFAVAQHPRTLFEHCERALERGVTSGEHGLPRIGAGDWNDGFDRVGARGAGESVWLGWFAFAAMNGFARLCERRGEEGLAKRWRVRAEVLEQAIAHVAWDGDWWLRAFDDDGRPLGSSANDECRIDSIAQSWAVLSGARSDARARRALASAARELVDPEANLVRLLWPPFDVTPRDPGYVKAYPPGIRENGGQYTHAAAWLALAFAECGDGDSAYALFERMNPICHSRTREEAMRYRVEPYALAGDIGSVGEHRGRGGWTWYTGSAAWAWRVAVEGILGLRLRGGGLALRPCLPTSWDRYEATIRGPQGSLSIEVRVVEAPAGPLQVDGEIHVAEAVAFPTDGSERRVELFVARSGSAG